MSEKHKSIRHNLESHHYLQKGQGIKGVKDQESSEWGGGEKNQATFDGEVIK